MKDMGILAEQASQQPTSRHGIEIRPVYRGDFDREPSRGKRQVRVNLWGWPAALLETLFRRSWKRRHITIED